MKVKVSKVWVNRAEGPIDQCRDYTFEGPDALQQAQRQMFKWGTTVSPGGGYDKCDFVVTFEDGEMYSGRYDLKGDGLADDGLTIAGQIRRMLRFWAGEWRPAWCNDKEWGDICKRHEAGADEAREWLEKYELEAA